MKPIITVAVIGALVPACYAIAPLAAAAQEDSSAISAEISELKKGQDAIRKDLEEIKKLLAARPAPPAAPPAVEKIDAVVAVGGIAPQGKAAAPLTLIEFTDYQCPYCSRHAQQTVPQLVKDYVDTGKVRYTIRDFPLEQIHPNAAKAAEAARCAGDQDKYWEMHDKLFSNQKELQPEKLAEYAKAIGLNEGAFKACLDQGKYTQAVKQDLEAGSKLGVRGTPTVVLGVSDGAQVKNAVIIRGAQSYANFKAEIDKLLAPPAAEKQ